MPDLRYHDNLLVRILRGVQVESGSRIFVAGHRGLVGQAVVRKLREKGFHNLILKERKELDLLRQQEVEDFFAAEKVDYVVIAAARVGGILANRSAQADFLYENLCIASNLIHSAFRSKVEKLLFLGSSCIYPKLASQPIKEDYLLTGPLEETNEGYAIAKIAGLKLCEMYARQYGARFISAMPTNLYGPGDNFHPDHSHVIPGMMRRFHEAKIKRAKEVIIWGSGQPRREFLHVDDLADALLVLMESYEDYKTINVGTGTDCTILELSNAMKSAVGYQGELGFDRSKPDGTPQKLLDIGRIKELGWTPKINLQDGLNSTYQWATANSVFDMETAKVG